VSVLLDIAAPILSPALILNLAARGADALGVMSA
jgi:hypothetical protein